MSKSASRDSGPPGGGPSIVVRPLWTPGHNPGHPLTADERATLAIISTVIRFKKGELIYKGGERANAVFNIVNGVVKSYKEQPRHRQHIVGFWFSDDLIGLAYNGKYVNSAMAIANSTLYKISTAPLEARLRQRPGLDFQVISNLCYDLREAQRHAFLLSEQHAIAKVALFIQMLEIHQAREQSVEEVYLPMTQSDIGSYVGISTEAVNRSFRELVNRGAITFPNRRYCKIVDRNALEAARSEGDRGK